MCYEIPGDIQQLCIYIWMESTDSCEITQETVYSAIEKMLLILKNSYEKIYDSLSGQQVQYLKALARFKSGKSNISKEFLSQSQIDLTQSAKKAATALINKKIVIKENKTYRFSDPFFKEWIRSL